MGRMHTIFGEICPFKISTPKGWGCRRRHSQNPVNCSNYQKVLGVKCGPKFGSNKLKTAKVIRALYGLPVAGAAFRSYLSSKLRTLGCIPLKADPDLWMKPAAVKPDGTEYYEYLFAYVDDLYGMSMDTNNMYNAIGEMFTLKKKTRCGQLVRCS